MAHGGGRERLTMGIVVEERAKRLAVGRLRVRASRGGSPRRTAGSRLARLHLLC